MQHVLLFHICVLFFFNYINDTGVYPESWSKGVIIPIFKKGETNSPSNYITLINIMAKIFSLTLIKRINKWYESENILTTINMDFVIIAQHQTVYFCYMLLFRRSKLYCAFIDYERAFDTVIYEAMWVKLRS